jgi:LPS-assembly lipoprotein
LVKADARAEGGNVRNGLCAIAIRTVATVSLLTVSACGFTPLYGVNNGAAPPGQSLASIYVEPIPERVGYELRNDLLDLLNASTRDAGAAYRLKLVITEERLESATLQRDATITRYNYHLTAHYDLFARDGTAAVKSGNVSTLTAYNVASSPYATVVAERDASDRAANDIAERIRTELAVYFRETGAGLN